MLMLSDNRGCFLEQVCFHELRDAVRFPIYCEGRFSMTSSNKVSHVRLFSF